MLSKRLRRSSSAASRPAAARRYVGFAFLLGSPRFGLSYINSVVKGLTRVTPTEAVPSSRNNVASGHRLIFFA